MAQAGEPREAYGVRAACCRCPMPLRDEDGGRPANRSAAQKRQQAARTSYAGAPSERSPRLESAPLTPAGSTQNSEEPNVFDKAPENRYFTNMKVSATELANDTRAVLDRVIQRGETAK